MDTVKSHQHTFLDQEWPFADPVNAVAISTVKVFRQNYPILRVSHDLDGDWQVLCGTTVESKDGMVVCLGCAFQIDRSIGELADLPLGWHAWREKVGTPWIREESDVDDEQAC